MRSLKFWIKVTRLPQCLIAAGATWLTALLSNGPLWLTTEKIAAAAVMFIGVAGSSLLHYGIMAKKTYARKYWDVVDIERPDILIELGSYAICIAILLSMLYLPQVCISITLIDALAIVAYSLALHKHWTSKNLTIALICTTPILLGWLSGHRLHAAVPYFIGTVFFAYLAREIIKDYTDLVANHGHRITLPMWLGAENALRVAAACVALSIICLIPVLQIIELSAPLALVPFVLAVLIFTATGYLLVKFRHVHRLPTCITVGNSCIMAATLLLRMGRP